MSECNNDLSKQINSCHKFCFSKNKPNKANFDITVHQPQIELALFSLWMPNFILFPSCKDDVDWTLHKIISNLSPFIFSSSGLSTHYHVAHLFDQWLFWLWCDVGMITCQLYLEINWFDSICSIYCRVTLCQRAMHRCYVRTTPDEKDHILYR